MARICDCKFNSRIAYLQDEDDKIIGTVLISEYKELEINNVLQVNKYKLVCEHNKEVIYCCGNYKNKYFRHKNDNNNNNTGQMTTWHSDWQHAFEPDVEKDIGPHRADVLIEKTKKIIEFQHSIIRIDKIISRNNNCWSYGYEMFWVIDCNDCVEVIPEKDNIRIEFKKDTWKFYNFIGIGLKYIYLSYSDCVYKIDPEKHQNNTFIVNNYLTDDQFVSYIRNNDEWDSVTKMTGNIYYNQRGAGCGKTYESIQLLNCDKYPEKHIFIYLTKVHSAKSVIKKELEEQFGTNKLKIKNLVSVSSSYNTKQYKYTFDHPKTNEEAIILIGTIDSFCYAVCKNKSSNIYSDYFAQIVDEINKGSLTITSKGQMTYAGQRITMNKKCMIIIDECQDLQINYIHAMDNIIRKTGIDLYIVGDLLQSLYSIPNVFTYLSENKDKPDIFNAKIIYNTGENKVRRFHNKEFISFVNDIVNFDDYALPPITSICDGECNYNHDRKNVCNVKRFEYDIYRGDSNNKNQSKNDTEYKSEITSYIIGEVGRLVDKYGYMPYNFMFIFPVLTNNVLSERLCNELEIYWQNRFKNDKIRVSAMKKFKRKSKIENLNYDVPDHYVYLHMSEEGKPIDLEMSVLSTRILSIHASKGNGCEVVFVIGLSQEYLSMLSMREGEQKELKYESLIHVALTRQKEKLCVLLRHIDDNITARFNSFNVDYSYYNEKIITTQCNLNRIIDYAYAWDNPEKNIRFEEIKNIIGFNLSDTDANDLIDWNDHIIRNYIFKIYFFNSVSIENDMGSEQYKAKIKKFLNAKIKDYKNNDEYYYQIYKCSDINNIPFPVYTKDNYARYIEIIKIYIDIIKQKIKEHENEIFISSCPVEIIIFYYCLDIFENYFGKNIFCIKKLCHIIGNYCSNGVDETEHRDCKCVSYFNTQEVINNSKYVHHYDKLGKINDAIKKYIEKITSKIDEPVEYFMYHSIKYLRNNWSVESRPYIIGLSEHYVVNVYYQPQINSLNYYKMLIDVIFTNYIISKSEHDNTYMNKGKGMKFIGKKIITIIITSDNDNIIFCDEYTISDENETFLKRIIGSYYLSLADNYHNMIRSLHEHHKNAEEKLFIYANNNIINKKNVPNYVKNDFKAYKNAYYTNDADTLNYYRNVTKEQFCEDMKNELARELDEFLFPPKRQLKFLQK